MIIKHPHPILQMVCEPIDFATDQVIIDDLRAELAALGPAAARGLSAPQIGYAKRCFAMFAADEIRMVCNPVIERFSDQIVEGEEGCLSLPWLNNVKIKRHLGIIGHYFTPNGDRKQFHYHSMEARVFQHESEHLDGITIDQRRREP